MRIRAFKTPYAQLCLSVFLSILVGWGLLMLPGMGARKPVTPLDGLFTATSAICVTGLVVRSTGHDFTLLGQAVILAMIQIGGLGFMTLSSSVLMHLRRKITLDQFAVFRASLGLPEGQRLPALMRRCFRLVAVIEVAGAALLFPRFNMAVPYGETIWSHAPKALWQSLFHSISAFCNAGFSVWDDSMARYVADPYVNCVMGGLIVLGGLGFFVLADVEEWIRARRDRREHRFSFQSRVVLATSLGLIVTGALFVWLGDRLNPATVQGGGIVRGVLIPLFQSITARTAGFSTVDMSALTNPSIFVTILLMFIGASPGSCGGGVKTTTFAVFATMAVGSLSRDEEPSFQRRSFGPVTVRSAVTLIVLSAGIVLAGALFLMFVEGQGAALSTARPQFVELLFETVSAFATVGLSTGITPTLTGVGKLCLILLMFVGRVGPLGLVSATLRGGVDPAVQYPAEDVQIG